MKIGCVVMASGFSRRFGVNKLLTPFRGRPLVAHTLDQLPLERLDRITVVTRWPQVAELCRVRGLPCLVHDLPHLSDTIRLGLETMGDTEGCLFTVGDQPLCSRESLERLMDGFLTQPNRPARLSWQGVPGNPVIFPRRLYPALLTLTGEQGGACVLPREVTLVECVHPAELSDGDTPAELARLEGLKV